MSAANSVAAPSENALYAQLFRYAQDLEALIQQQNRLQEQHRMLLQSLGRDIPSKDQLPALLLHCGNLILVTDPRGCILRVSSGLCDLLNSSFAALNGRHLHEIAHNRGANSIQELIEKFSDAKGFFGAIQLDLDFERGQADRLSLPGLAMQMQVGESQAICWFFLPANTARQSPTETLNAFFNSIHGEQGLLLTDPNSEVLTVNPSLEKLSGYSSAELRGHNPRTLGSSRHSPVFFKEVWREVQTSGQWSGTLFNRHKNGHLYLIWQTIKRVDAADGTTLAYWGTATDLTQNDQGDEELKALAFHDLLTGLPNRRALLDNFATKLLTAQKDQAELAVLFLDLNKFKPINDELGHEVGDQVLKQVALRIKALLGVQDFVARHGGDEFVILLPGSDCASKAQMLGAQLQKILSEPIQTSQHIVSVGASMGCALYPIHGVKQSDLFDRADSAMYHAKRLGQAFCLYDQTVQRQSKRHLDTDIWKAIALGQLHLEYQPQLCTDGSRSLRGCEVLVRWLHPVHGPIATTEFIPVAENNGAIVPIGQWVLTSAIAQLADWLRQGLSDFTLSVNVSLKQLQSGEFSEHILSLLRQHQVPGNCLELEFSESDTLLLRNEDTQKLKTLRENGVRLSIDDFGTSFSSLARLSSLSIGALKINSQFVQEIEAHSAAHNISQTLLSVGKILGIGVIAQGVENANQARLLNLQGCQVMQGFYAGAPMSASHFQAFFAKRNRP